MNTAETAASEPKETKSPNNSTPDKETEVEAEAEAETQDTPNKKKVKSKNEKKGDNKKPNKGLTKKLTRNRSLMEGVLDDYVAPAQVIELGDGKIEGTEILVSSWNVASLNALLKKPNLIDYVKDRKPDVLCLNETKLTDENFIEIGTKWIPEGYYSYFNNCKVRKGYSGTAIITKHKPISVVFDLGIKKHDLEGRTITLEFETFYIVACYVPNAGDKLVGLGYRTEEWDPDFRNYLNELRKKKNVVLCGDLNCAHHEIDIHRPKGNERSAGFTIEERNSFTQLLDSGFVDTFRHFNPTEQKFSYFSKRFGDFRAQNKGWRLDYVLVNKEGMVGVKNSFINEKIYGSDHLPVELVLNPQFKEESK